MTKINSENDTVELVYGSFHMRTKKKTIFKIKHFRILSAES